MPPTDPVACPCCNNPWSKPAESFALSCEACFTDDGGVNGLDPKKDEEVHRQLSAAGLRHEARLSMIPNSRVYTNGAVRSDAFE